MQNDEIETPTIGEILSLDFMKPLGISAYRLAKDIKVPVSRIQDILHGRRAISMDTSIRLGRYFGVNEHYFLSLQEDIDERNAFARFGEEYETIRCVKENSPSHKAA